MVAMPCTFVDCVTGLFVEPVGVQGGCLSDVFNEEGGLASLGVEAVMPSISPNPLRNARESDLALNLPLSCEDRYKVDGPACLPVVTDFGNNPSPVPGTTLDEA